MIYKCVLFHFEALGLFCAFSNPSMKKTDTSTVNCTAEDFRKEGVLVKARDTKCTKTSGEYTVHSLQFSSFDVSKDEDHTYIFVYENDDYMVEQIVEKIPCGYPMELILVRTCCDKHFNNRQLTIKDRKQGREIVIDL